VSSTKPIFVGAVVCAALSTLFANAWAQAPTTARAEGGVPLGEKSRLHANLNLSTMYDTNAFRSTDEEAAERWRLLVRPGLLLDVPGTQFSFNARGDLTLTQFLDEAPAAIGDTQIGGNLGVNLRAGSSRSALAFTLANTLTKTPVFLSEPETVAADEVRFPEWRNNGQATVTVRPGGRALELDFGYRNTVSFFDTHDLDDDETVPNSHHHLGTFDVRWRFLPKTAAIFTSSFGVFVNEFDPSLDGRTPDEIARLVRGNNNATPLNLQVGLIGQLTPRISTELRVGYGNALVWQSQVQGNSIENNVFGEVAEDSQDTVTAAAFVSYGIGQQASITGGYERTVRPLIIFDSYIQDAFQLRGRVGIDRFVGQVFGSYNLRNFGLNDRFAQVLLGGVSLDYYIVKYVIVGAQYRITYQESDDDEQDNIGPLNPFVGDFTRHQVVFTLGVEY